MELRHQGIVFTERSQRYMVETLKLIQATHDMEVAKYKGLVDAKRDTDEKTDEPDRINDEDTTATS